MRFTKTWSPISSVFSIELDGISNACTTNVMMNKPGHQHRGQRRKKLDRVSFGFSSARPFFLLLVFFFAHFAFVISFAISRGVAALRP